MSTWTEEMEELWREEVAEWPCTASYESFTFDCVRNPIKSGFAIQVAGYDQRADTIIDILRTKAVEIGLYGFQAKDPQQKRPIMVSDGVKFQVLFMENDNTAQPSVRFFCAKVLAQNA